MPTKRYGNIEVAKIRTLLANINRTLQIIDSDIELEEARARISDRSDPAYPLIARVMTVRRDNLKQTIATLENQLAELNAETGSVLEPA